MSSIRLARFAFHKGAKSSGRSCFKMPRAALLIRAEGQSEGPINLWVRANSACSLGRLNRFNALIYVVHYQRDTENNLHNTSSRKAGANSVAYVDVALSLKHGVDGRGLDFFHPQECTLSSGGLR